MNSSFFLTLAAILMVIPVAWSDDAGYHDGSIATEAAVIGASSGLIIPQDYGSSMLIGHSHGEGTYTAFKGNLGENLMDDYYASEGDWHRIEPARVSRNRATGELVLQRPGSQGRSGLDGVYIRYDNNGNPQRVMVTEAKAFGSQLARDVNGDRQFSKDYRASRLALTAQHYLEAGQSIERGIVTQAVSRPRAHSYSQIPIHDTRSFLLWFDAATGKWTYYTQSGVSQAQVAKQLGLISALLQYAADGRVSYSARLFRFSIDLNDNATIQIVDPESGLERQHTGKLSDLPHEQRVLIRTSLVRSIADDLRLNNPPMRYRDAQQRAASMVLAAERHGKVGELAHNYRPTVRYSSSIGLSTSGAAGAAGSVLASAIDAAFQLGTAGDVDLLDAGSVVGLGASSGLMGTWSGAQTQFALNSQPAQRLSNRLASSLGGGGVSGTNATLLARLGGGIAGGSVAGAIFSYGAYAMGMTDLQTANRGMLAGTAGAVAGVAASEATIALVAAYGTASTGTAIGGLTGVAASNASLAWLGGGSLAAGGLGTAGGVVILSTGVGIIIVGIASATFYLFDVLDAGVNQQRIEYLLNTMATVPGVAVR